MHMDKIMILTTSKFERLVKNRVAQEMMVQNVSLEKDLAQKQADITYLQNQINPHFLYNTLDSIHWRAMAGGNEEISIMVESLGTLLRASLSQKHSLVPLKEELELVHRYLLIQKIRCQLPIT